MMRMLDRVALDRGETVTVDDDRPTAQLLELVAYAVQRNARVVITSELRRGQVARLRAIGGDHLVLMPR